MSCSRTQCHGWGLEPTLCWSEVLVWQAAHGTKAPTTGPIFMALLTSKICACDNHFPNFCTSCVSVECLVTSIRLRTSQNSLLTCEMYVDESSEILCFRNCDSLLTLSRAFKLCPVFGSFFSRFICVSISRQSPRPGSRYGRRNVTRWRCNISRVWRHHGYRCGGNHVWHPVVYQLGWTQQHQDSQFIYKQGKIQKYNPNLEILLGGKEINTFFY